MNLRNAIVKAVKTGLVIGLFGFTAMMPAKVMAAGPYPFEGNYNIRTQGQVPYVTPSNSVPVPQEKQSIIPSLPLFSDGTVGNAIRKLDIYAPHQAATDGGVIKCLEDVDARDSSYTYNVLNGELDLKLFFFVQEGQSPACYTKQTAITYTIPMDDTTVGEGTYTSAKNPLLHNESDQMGLVRIHERTN